MRSFFEKIKILKSKISFDEGKKQEIRQYLLQIMQTTPEIVRAPDQDRLNIQRSTKILFKPMPIYAIITALVLITGGTSFAAEGALPGEPLYGMKVGFNEKVVAAISLSAEAKAHWEAQLAARRLVEAAKLAAKGKLNAETKANLEERFALHAERTHARIQEMEARGEIHAAANVVSEFETSLRAHEQILAQIKIEESADTQMQIQPLEAKVNSVLNSVVDMRINLESEIGSINNSTDVSEGAKTEAKTAAEGKINAAMNMIASVKSFFENKKSELSSANIVTVQNRIKMAESLVADAKTKVDAGAFGEAFNIANEAIRIAQEARILIDANVSTDLEINIDTNDDWDPQIFAPTSAENEFDLRGQEELEIELSL